MTITLTLNGHTSVLVGNYFPPIELKEPNLCGLICFDDEILMV